MRSTSISYASWILLSLALSSTVHAQNYTLLHRFIPLRPDSNSPWVEYGTIQLTPTDQTSVIGGNALRGEFVVNANGRDAQSNDGRGWYQVGLVVDDYTFTSSIRSCYTASPQIYRFNIPLSGSSTETKPTGIHLDLTPAGINQNGDCPKGWYESGDRLFLPKGINTEVILKVPDQAKRINLNPAPVVDATTGQPAAPVEEKTFLQKYWIALVGVAFFILTQAAPEPPKQGAGAGGSAGTARAK